MEKDLPINERVTIPGQEIEIAASRAGGPGGQHVNKSNTRITVRWNLWGTQALTPEEKERVRLKWASRLTAEGDIIIHSSASRSQQQNKDMALHNLAQELRKALQVPKKRKKTKLSPTQKESRLREKSQRGMLKKMRGKITDE